MALHPAFPSSPYVPLVPEHRWFPAAEQLRASADKLLPPLVPGLRKEVEAWRAKGYPGASPTSATLLRWWFDTEHLVPAADGALSPFRYYFSQREAVETVIWLNDVLQAKDKFDLLRFDASGKLSHGMFSESWPRYVLKLATGAGKTKVLSLLIAWSYFHKLYEPGSTLARNILLIAPNIIVLDRLRSDFDGLKIFFNDPILPNNGHGGRNWSDDFQITLHIQDAVRIQRPFGNIFLTNIHRVYRLGADRGLDQAARDASFPHGTALVPYSEAIALHQDCRRSAQRWLRTRIRRLPRPDRRRCVVRQELHGRRFQARLRDRWWRPVPLRSRFPGEGGRWHGVDHRDQGSG